MENFKEKIIVITGGNSGIGLATAIAFKSKDATVIITGRRKDAVESCANKYGFVPFVADQAKLSDINALYQFIAQQFGHIDILFINAGITGTNELIENMTEENFDQVMSINLKGAYFTLSKGISLLAPNASVLILSSIAAQFHFPKSSVYQASKAAIVSVGKTAAKELASRNIRVNMISPGPTKTEVLSKTPEGKANSEAVFISLKEQIPLKRIGQPEEIAQMALFLSSNHAKFITGSEFILDGGLTL
ncbi:SDR family NAD(P)-dependent oxidoreductase [Rhizosphaericola mali]|uniref:SDR family oxidoreductase n=1 Tax=Rhizosphaericola mali TaxID=2545455 RepID=A0A5P2FZR0_9BACT|nr:SDR family oxidoreductase [Rhizosphaericola mali]QES88715.1 SDR family oxidoreductase [Rhizosphaericola mali]